MKLKMTELRRLVAESLKRTLTEARKKTGGGKKEIPDHTEKAELSRRDKQVKGTGYSHMDNGDFSQPLGDDNLYRRQGAVNYGNYTAESRLMKIIEAVVAEELKVIRGR